jgi:nucleotide-binding universal stress UspA family protein
MGSRECAMMYLRKILVPTDLSEFSLAAIEYATTLGLLFASKIFLLHVVEGKEGHTRYPQADPQAALEKFMVNQINPDIDLIPVVRFGNPAFEIKRFAEEEQVDLVVLATHGRTGLKHMVMGSVAEKVVRLSNIPVLAVKPHPMRDSILQNEDVEEDLHLR